MQQRHSGRPKDLKKRQAILQAAKDLFLELGYDGSSMDAIAQKAGVSKLTVYNHFNDKAQLFGAAIEMVCEQRLPRQLYEVNSDSDIEQVLQQLGEAFLNMVYSAEAMKLSHLMSSMVPSNIELVHLFYHAGPERTRHHMLSMFQKIQELALLKMDNVQMCSNVFLGFLTDTHYDRVIWQIFPVPTATEIQDIVAQRVGLFLKLYPLT
ncbi:MAG: TetR/AcrR family transcriptional regulator [Acinetobacter sp.]|jgi:TetR/AcrR family transcriptional repressor of mexJK operon|nr:MAG: TetR/AcrR family transcriptional regulator [Acinetobacter sp.]